ncbi:ISNCY family transposase [Treponema vincentii]|uniref:ISNCY family transposase n=1 Tax=Treponema vincentii TaxID=69710 RepID=UPI003D94DB99
MQGGDFTLKQVSFITGYSTRQLTNIKKQYAKEGVKAFENGHKGMKPKNRIPDKIKRQIVNIYKTEFLGFNFHFFAKALDEFYGIHYSYKTVYNILTKNGVASPEKRKVKKNKPVHRPRYRRERSGELVQIDATPYQWFEWCGDTAYYALHGAIDDAEGCITGLCMTENECSYGYYDILEQTIDNHGVMLELYSDRSAIFCVNPKDKDKLSTREQLKGIHEKRTQWQRILDDLQIKQILAWSPQAKGRVERMWRTLQGRLPWYFKRYKIKTIEAANAFLKKEYIKIFNDEFAIKQEKKAIWRQPPKNYKEHLCSKFERTTDNSGVISFQGYKFQIEAPHCAKKTIEICVYKDGIKALVDGMYHSVKLLENLTDGIGEQMSTSLKNIIYQYMLTDAKKVSA